MTAEQRFERELPEILADLYPVSAPDYRNDLVRQIAATRQRPAWALPERWIPVTALTLGRPVRPIPWRTIGVVALLLVAIAAAAIIAGGGPRRLPAPFGPASNGQLVLAEDGDIFLVNSVTGEKTLAIGGAASDTAPTFSRDGTQLAFLREEGGARSLWVADDRGGIPRRLATDGLLDFSQVEWSPDGKSILLTTSLPGRTAPAIVPTDGSAAHVIALDMPAENPIWLTSGQEILFRGTSPTGFGLFAIRPDGTDLRPIVPATGTSEWDALYFAVSPDGSQIAYQWRPTPTAAMLIYIIPTSGGNPRAITTVESVSPIWSPDGTWIAFWSDDGIYVVHADGSTPERRVVVKTKGGAAIRWAPDGGRLLFVPSDHANQLLFDPLGGPDETAAWSSTELPDWQRLAP
jgi:Tol biopolymer transport system component